MAVHFIRLGSMLVPPALVKIYATLLVAGGVFFLAAKPIAIVTLILGGLPSGLFFLLQYLVPVISFFGGFLARRSIPVALLLGMPLLPLSAIVLFLGSAGRHFMAVPVPWLSAVALGAENPVEEMLQTQALPYSVVAFIAGVLLGLFVRELSRPDAAPHAERSIEMIAGPFQIEEKFKLTGRGTVVVIAQTTNLPVGEVLHATIVLPDGSLMGVQAYKELLLRRTPEPIEKESYLLLGVEMAQVPPRSTIELCAI